MTAESKGRVCGDIFERAGVELENLNVHPLPVRIHRPATGNWTQETLEMLYEIRQPDTFPSYGGLSTLGHAAYGAVTRHAIPDLSWVWD